MQQINQGTISSYFVPYIQKILKDASGDRRLQSIFRFDTVLKLEDKKSLVDSYDFTNSPIYQNKKLIELFWDDLITYVGYQKQIAGGSAQKLALLMLPDEKGTFSKKALDNISQFAFMTVKGFEKSRIEDLIDEQEINKEISREKAEKLKGDLKKHKLMLARTKKEGAPFGIMSQDDLGRAIGSYDYRTNFLSNYYTEYSKGGEQIVPFIANTGKNGQEVTVSLPVALQSSFDSKAAAVAKTLLASGTVDIGKEGLKADKQGVIRGIVIDVKTKEKYKFEFNAAKPGEEKYRLTSELNPAKKLWVSGDSFKKTIKGKGSLRELLLEAEGKEPRKSDVRGAAFGRAAVYKPPAGTTTTTIKRQIKQTTTTRPPENIKTKYPKASALPIPPRRGAEASLYDYGLEAGTYEIKTEGVVKAKKRFSERKKTQTIQPGTSVAQTPPVVPKAKGTLPTPAKKKKKKKNPVYTALKVTGGAAAGAAVAGGAAATASAAAAITTVATYFCNVA